jgi:hypothetical protein
MTVNLMRIYGHIVFSLIPNPFEYKFIFILLFKFQYLIFELF